MNTMNLECPHIVVRYSNIGIQYMYQNHEY